MPKRNRVATLMLCLFAVTAPALAADEGKEKKDSKVDSTDQALIQGPWRVVKRVKNGEAEDVKEQPVTLTFAGSALTQSQGSTGRKTEGTFTIDASTSPKRITMTGKDGAHAGATFEGIYELTGDTLKIAYGVGDKAKTAPKDFTGGEGSGLLVLERQ